MKFYLKAFVLVLVLVGGFIGFVLIKDEAETETSHLRGFMDTPMAGDKPSIGQQFAGRAVQAANNRNAANNAAMERQAGSVIDKDKRAKLAALAKRERVELAAFTPVGGGATVRLVWYGDIATVGYDVLDLAIREGIVRDFEQTNKGSYFDKQGRAVWWTELRLSY